MAARMALVLFSGRNQVFIRCTHPERSLHGALRKITLFSCLCAFLTFSVRHLQTAMAGSPRAEGKEVVLKATDITQDFPRTCFLRDRVLRCSSATAVGCTC